MDSSHISQARAGTAAQLGKLDSTSLHRRELDLYLVEQPVVEMAGQQRDCLNHTYACSVDSLFAGGLRLCPIVCSLAAYAFARLDFYFKRPLYILVLIGLMVPFEATFLPVYLLFSNLKLHNTLIALILPGLASSFAVFLLTQFFRGIPLELEEAAMMDGAGRFRIFLTIIIPLSTPVITALAIFTFLGNWNSYLWPIISATSSEVYTIVIGLRKLNQAWGDVNFYGRDMAAAVFTALPIIIFFFVFQRRIISGIAINSGIK